MAVRRAPRLEEYLELLPSPDRGPLLAELLASELAMRRQHNEACDRDEYALRFPQHSDVVFEIFRQSQVGADPAAFGQRCLEIIQSVRSHLQTETDNTAIHVAARKGAIWPTNWSAARCRLQAPPPLRPSSSSGSRSFTRAAV